MSMDRIYVCGVGRGDGVVHVHGWKNTSYLFSFTANYNFVSVSFGNVGKSGQC